MAAGIVARTMTLTVGPSAVLGDRYRLVERIAVGGQGEVWRADDTALGRTVAVKVLRGEYAGSPEFRERFRGEARHAAALSYPGVAQVYDYDEGHGDVPPYLVMEFVDGEPLSAEIARDAPMRPARVLEVVEAAASALAVAHAAGFVHRDVKPGNLLVGRDGAIKITDFGIARAVDAVPLTRTGTVLGTPQYLAPEQATGRPATAATDLYALGIIAYEMLAGSPPFEGPATAVLVAHRDTPLPDLPPAVPARVRELVRALTAKDPAARPGGAAAVAEAAHRLRTEPATTAMDLGAILADPGAPSAGSPATGTGYAAAPGPAPAGRAAAGFAAGGATQILDAPPVPSPRRRWPLVAGGALAIALAAGVVGWLAGSSPGRPSPSPTPSAAVSQPAPAATPTTHRPVHHAPVIHHAPVRPRPKGKSPKKHKPPKHGHHG